MTDLLNKLEYISVPRQQHKVKHFIKDIVGIVLFATLANTNEWTEIEDFAVEILIRAKSKRSFVRLTWYRGTL